MLVKGRRIVVPPLFGSFLPSSQRLTPERLGFSLTVERRPNLSTYRQIILQGHFQLCGFDSFHQTEPLYEIGQVYFPYQRIYLFSCCE